MQTVIASINGPDTITCENAHLRIVVVPALGGKIASIYNKALDREFLWTNAGLSLQALPPGSEYDPNFYGGMDELIPNDIPETIQGIDYPDHGELWTAPLEYAVTDEAVMVFGTLPLSGLFYEKTIRLDATRPEIHIDYEIRNDADASRQFLWKLHPALRVEAGDRLVTTASKARVVDAEYSRFKDLKEFTWPWIEGVDAARIPPIGSGMDFFFLWGAEKPEMSIVSERNNTRFTLQYDAKIFPYQWYFASYGGFLGHYTAVLEPCSSMPLSVTEAASLGQCSLLEAGQTIETSIRLYAGANTTDPT